MVINMEYELLEEFKNIDDKFFKNIEEVRDVFVESGDDVVQDNKFNINKLINKNYLNKEPLSISKIRDLDSCIEITLSTKETRSLPDFKAGQYIILSTYIAGNYYSRPYYIVATNEERLNGYYRIYVLKEDNSIMAQYLSKVKIDTDIYVSGPFGEFTYNSVRDANNIIMIVSNYGINAAYANMLKIIDGLLKVKLHVIYTVKKYEDILYREELENITKHTNKITLDIIISDEVVEGYKYGFASADIISQYLDKDTSIFICGKEGLLKFLNKELEVFKLPRKYIRYENYLPRCNVKNPKKYDLYIKYKNKGVKHSCYNNKTLLDAIEDSRVVIDSISRTGKDNLCNVRIISGKVKVVNDMRNSSEKLFQLVDPANCYPNSDIKIEII
jgi:NAD(P)H-flavin reductase